MLIEKMANLEPIRKPSHKEKYRFNHCRRISRLANARLFASGEQVQMQTGITFDFESVFTALRRFCKTRIPIEERMQGIAHLECSFGYLSKAFLNSCSQNLNKWELRLQSSKPKQIGRTRLKKELAEIESLSSRIRQFGTLVERTKWPTTNVRESFVLLADEERELARITESETRLTAFQLELARLIYWFRGASSARKFIQSLAAVLNRTEEHILNLVFIRDRMQQILKHSDKNCLHFTIEQLERDERFRKSFRHVYARQKWKGFSDGKSARRNLAIGIKAYTRTINKNCYQLQMFVPVILAAWAITTELDLPFPEVLIDRYVQSQFKSRLHEQAKFVSEMEQRRGFVKLNQLLNKHQLPTSVRFNRRAVCWLENGASEQDLLFAARIWKDIKFGSGQNLRQIRNNTQRLVCLLEMREVDAVALFIGWTRKPLKMKTIELLLNWLSRFPKQLLPKIQNRFIKIMKPFDADDSPTRQMEVEPFEAAIERWARVWRDQETEMANESQLPKQLRAWTRRLARYQSCCDRDVKLPKSIRDHLDQPRKRQRELQYLRSQHHAGTIDDQMSFRLRYLETARERNESKYLSKIIRATQEAVLVVGIESLHHEFFKIARNKWKRQADQVPIRSTSFRYFIALNCWAERMSGPQLRLLRTTLTAAQETSRFKEHLVDNKDWIKSAKRKGLNTDLWICPVAETRCLGGAQYEFYVSNDPFEIYSMGNYFDTCLSQGGCNEMSVLANAAHANKQVVFVADSNRKIVARKLIAISKDFQLVGYNNYCVYGVDQEKKREAVLDGVNRYCAKLAFQVGIELADEGEPRSLGNDFWYDDSEVDWPKSATEQYDELASANLQRGCCEFLVTGARFHFTAQSKHGNCLPVPARI